MRSLGGRVGEFARPWRNPSWRGPCFGWGIRASREVECVRSDEFTGAVSGGNSVYGAESVSSPHKLALPVVRSSVGRVGAGFTAGACTCKWITGGGKRRSCSGWAAQSHASAKGRKTWRGPRPKASPEWNPASLQVAVPSAGTRRRDGHMRRARAGRALADFFFSVLRFVWWPSGPLEAALAERTSAKFSAPRRLKATLALRQPMRE